MKACKKLITVVALLFFLLVLAACGKEKEEEKEKLDFTICDEKQIPQELKEILEEK